MTADETTRDPRSLLGLRPPAEPAARRPTATPERPSYPTVSSGWDSEDDQRTGNSDLVTALGAGAGLLVLLALFGLLLS